MRVINLRERGRDGGSIPIRREDPMMVSGRMILCVAGGSCTINLENWPIKDILKTIFSMELEHCIISNLKNSKNLSITPILKILTNFGSATKVPIYIFQDNSGMTKRRVMES